MLSPTIRKMIEKMFGSSRRPIRKARQGVRPGVEMLEDRRVPATCYWTGADAASNVSNAWSDPKNWVGGHVAGAGDTAVFSNTYSKSGNCGVNGAVSIASLQIDGTWNGNLSVGQNSSLTLTGSSEWDSGDITTNSLNSSVVNNGTLRLGSLNNVYFQGGGTLQNNGTINVASKGNLGLVGDSNGTTVVNAAGAVIDFQDDGGIGNNYATNHITNAGTIEKTGGQGTSQIYAFLTNNGGLLNSASSGGILQVWDGGAGSNGTYQAAAGATLEFTNSTFTETGTFTGSGAGTIALEGGTLAVGKGGATFNIPSTVAFNWDGGTISMPTNTTLVYNGVLNIIDTNGSVGLGGGGTFQNNGTLNQVGSAAILSMGGTGSVATTLNNTAKGVLNFQADAKVQWGGGAGGVINNSGLIEKTGGTGTTDINQPLINNGGTLDAASGILQIDTNSTNTNGTYEAAAGATLDLTGGNTFSEAGTFTAGGAGVITLGGGTFKVYNGSATVNVPGTLTFQVPGGTINVPTNDTLTVNGNLALTGSNDEILAGGGTLTENGTITQSGGGNLAIAGNTVATTLNISKSSTYDFANDSGIVWGGGPGGVVLNAGLVEKTNSFATSAINGVAFSNQGGTLNVATGTLQLASNGGLNTGGLFQVAGGAALDLTGSSTVKYTGTYTGSGGGQVLLGGGTLQVSGTGGTTFNLPTNMFVWNGGTINTNGSTFNLTGKLSINSNQGSENIDGGGMMSVSGTITDSGTANDLNIDTHTTLALQKGTFNLAADANVTGNGMLQILGGLLEKTAATGTSTLSASLDNQGEILVTKGTLVVSGFVDEISNNTLTGGTWEVAGGSNVAALQLTYGPSVFNTIGQAASVLLNGKSSSFANLSNLTVNDGLFTLLGGASLTTAGNFTDAGTLTLGAGSTLSVAGSFTETADGTLVEQMGGTSSSPTFGSLSAKGMSLAGAFSMTSTVVPAVGSSFEVVNNGATSAISGAFVGMPEGSTFTVTVGATKMTFKISYKGGTGNDVVLTRTA
jgi:hypothetical protein